MSIVYYPAEVLLNPTEKLNVQEYGLTEIKKLKQKMIEEMIKHEGIGLAANQIGLNIRAFVMFLPSSVNNETIILINPEIVKKGKDTVINKEGCLSFPEIRVDKKRNKIVTVKYTDENGIEKERVFKGIEAVCAQHEIDHLDGITFVDDLPDNQKNEIMEKLSLLKKE